MTYEPRRVPVPVTILTGFLGSGKTTVLNHLLTQPGMNATAAIVNEFGEIGIDDALISRSSSDAVLLRNGCVCCSVKDDLTQTLQNLIVQSGQGKIPKFRRVIIETTGLADPGPILHLLMREPLVVARYRMDGVVATVDAYNGSRTLDEFPEAVHQAAVADRLLLTKADIAEPARREDIEQRLRNLNPAAQLLWVAHGRVSVEALFDIGLFRQSSRTVEISSWLPLASFERRDKMTASHDVASEGDRGRDHDHHQNAAGHHGIRSFAVVRDRPITWSAFSRWLEAVALGRGRDLLRVKGIVSIAEHPEEPVVVHGVQELFHPPVRLDRWPSSDRRTRIVFITRNLARDALEQAMRHFEVEHPFSPP